jgi:hypothetical protein
MILAQMSGVVRIGWPPGPERSEIIPLVRGELADSRP